MQITSTLPMKANTIRFGNNDNTAIYPALLIQTRKVLQEYPTGVVSGRYPNSGTISKSTDPQNGILLIFSKDNATKQYYISLDERGKVVKSFEDREVSPGVGLYGNWTEIPKSEGRELAEDVLLDMLRNKAAGKDFAAFTPPGMGALPPKKD